jgi:hypothetical protein
MEKKESLVVRHVGDIYRHANSGKGHSWRILNGALSDALRLCITAHLRFQLDDFHTIYRQFQGGYWFGTDGDGKGSGTSLYSIAVDCGNMSACLAFEAWRTFDPWLYMGRRLAVAGMPYNSTAGELWWLTSEPAEIIAAIGTKTTELQVLEKIERNPYAERWWVTGFNADTLRLANYVTENNPAGHRDGKPVKLMQLTHDDLEARSKAIRAAIKAARPKKEKGVAA